MGAGPVPVGVQDTLTHLSDPRRTWYNNKWWVSFLVVLLVLIPVDRLIILHAWIALPYVWKIPHVSYGSSNNVLFLAVSSPRLPMVTTAA